MLDVNLGATFRLTRAALRGMVRRRYGRIVSITFGRIGVTGNPGQANYAASKAGMIGMSKSIAAEVATMRITVNCVAPGFIATAMTEKLSEEQQARIAAQIPTGRMGTGDGRSPPRCCFWRARKAPTSPARHSMSTAGWRNGLSWACEPGFEPAKMAVGAAGTVRGIRVM